LKKIFLFVCFFAVFLLVFPNALATGTLFDSKARLTLVRTNPDVIKPGSYFDAYFRLEDLDDNFDLKNARIVLKEKFPFSVYEGDLKTRYLGSIKDGNLVEFKYRIWVDESVNGGNYELYFILRADNMQEKESFIELEISPIEAALVVDSISVFPEKIKPGEKVQLNIRLRNTAGILMRDIDAKINLDSVPITPLHSGVEKRVNFLRKDDFVDLTFDVIVDNDAEVRPYKIPLELTYYDSGGNSYYWNTSFGFLVESVPEYQIDIEDSEVFMKGQSGKVVLSVSNVGPSDINFLSLELKEGNGYKVIGSNRVYIGNLESDDYDTAEFEIYVDKDKFVDLNLLVRYKDSYNKDFSDNKQARLKLYSYREAVKYGLIKGRNFSWIVWLIVIVFIYSVINQWRKDKELGIAIKNVVRRWLGFVFRPLLKLKKKR